MKGIVIGSVYLDLGWHMYVLYVLFMYWMASGWHHGNYSYYSRVQSLESLCTPFSLFVLFTHPSSRVVRSMLP